MLERKCIATNEIKDVTDMIRVVKTKNGKFLVDSQAKGHGAYISKDANLVKILMHKKLLNKAFKVAVPLEVYALLKQKLEDDDEKK